MGKNQRRARVILILAAVWIVVGVTLGLVALHGHLGLAAPGVLFGVLGLIQYSLPDKKSKPAKALKPPTLKLR